MRLLLMLLSLLTTTHSGLPVPDAGAAAPVSLRAAAPVSPRAAVLVYHHVGEKGLPGTVTPDQFAAHLQMLKAKGYHILHPDEFAAYMAGLMPIPDRSVLITFDDSYESLYTEVYPLLQEYQAPVLAFAITHWFDHEGPFPGLPHLSREQAREMVASGLVSLQVHTHDQHRQLPTSPSGGDERSAMVGPRYRPDLGRLEDGAEYRRRVRADLRRARQVLMELGMGSIQLVHFAPPYGEVSPELLAVAREEGFRLFYTTRPGLAAPQDLLAIPRFDAGEPWVSPESLQRWLHTAFAAR